jgi:two-component system cell cycle response regulator DivK
MFPGSNGPTILYVEDDLNNRTLVRRVLMVEDFHVVEAATAADALRILEIEGLVPDLILMDINMPEMDGFTLTARLKQIPALAHTPIIALTANVMRGDKERTLEAGCDGYLQKPIDVDTLPRQILDFLREARHD